MKFLTSLVAVSAIGMFAQANAEVLSNGQTLTISGTQGSSVNHSLAVPSGASNLAISISGGTGDADLYTRFGSQPSTSSYDCRPYLSGNNESCTVETPEEGTYHIQVRAYSSYSSVALSTSYTEPSGSGSSSNAGGASGISVTEALALSQGAAADVEGIIVGSNNGVYALEMADVNNASNTIVVKLESAQRNDWSPENNSSVIGQTVLVSGGQRDTYGGLPSIESVDSIELIDSGSNNGSGGSGGGNACTDASLALLTDNYGSETSWTIVDGNSATVQSGGNYSSNTSYTLNFCLAEGTYSFTINDSYGDGICCSYGNGSFAMTSGSETLFSGGEFASSQSIQFTIGNNGGNGNSGGSTGNLSAYYASAEGLTGYALKSALHDIIDGHSNQGYSAIWGFYEQSELDNYYENDGTILDIYSERPNSSDPYTFVRGNDQCGNYSGEGSCYNREHSLPRSWFGGSVEPMNSDVHHIFATDGYVNSKRSSYPYGEVGSASWTSNNGSKLGAAVSGLGYTGTVFEPIDEFKGDVARAYFYMATRYQDVVSAWQNNSSNADAVLNGSSDQVFEAWQLAMLKQWHNQDPVSQKELDRNNAAEAHQGNRNPFVDYPEFVEVIWGN